MCESKNKEALRNGHAGDPVTQGHALADLLDAVGGIEDKLRNVQKTLGEIPTRSEVRDMIHSSLQIHVETCDAARDGKPVQPDKFKFGIGKFFGIEAQGNRGVLFGALLGIGAAILVFKVAPYLKEWLAAMVK